MHTYAAFAEYLKGGRDKTSRPLANNTRVERRSDDCIAIRLHGTDVVQHFSDGRIILNSGGWRTVTTKDRINAYSPARIYAEGGVWYVDLRPDPNDPRPARDLESIPKPFHALDPGPEPVKSAEGCIAGEVQSMPYDEEKLVTRRELDPNYPNGWTEDSIVRPYDRPSDYFAGYVRVHGLDVTYFGETAHAGYGVSYHARIDEQFGTLSPNDRAHYAQCPHCAAFERHHRAWDLAMNGERWGRNRGKGYRQMCEMLERFGDHDAWQDAYIANVRERREAAKRFREWLTRNRTEFEDGVEINSDGYALRADPDAEEKARARDAMKKRISAYVVKVREALKSGELAMPSGGDCWYCALHEVNTGVEMGDLGGDPANTHLLDHLEEGYVVPSLLVNAMRERGYQDAGVYMLLGMKPEEDTMGGRPGDDYDPVVRAVRAYLTSRLIPEATGSAPTGAARRETGLQTG